MGLTWYRDLYEGELIRARKGRLKEAVDRGDEALGVWLVMVPKEEERQLELLPAKSMHRREARERCVLAAGIAFGRAEALRVVQRIVRDAASDGMGDRPREWLLEKNRNAGET